MIYVHLLCLELGRLAAVRRGVCVSTPTNKRLTRVMRARPRRQRSVIFFLRQDLVVLHEADVLRVRPEALPADVHVVFADDGLLVAADAAPAAALAELLRVAVDEGLGTHLLPTSKRIR